MSPLNLGSQGQECAGRDEYVRRFQDMDTDASKSIDFDEMLAYYQPWLKPAAAGSGPAGAERGIRSFLENQMVQLQREPAQEGPTWADACTSQPWAWMGLLGPTWHSCGTQVAITRISGAL